MKKALLIESRRLDGGDFLRFVGEPLEWPTVEGFEIVASLRLGEIQEGLGDHDQRLSRRIKEEKIDAVLFAHASVFGELKGIDLVRLLDAVSPHVPGESGRDHPLVAVLTRDNKVSGPVRSLAFNFIEPATVGL